MQPHIKDTTSSSALGIATTVSDRRRSERRWNSDFVVTRYVVVLNLGGVCRAELVNESPDGLAIQVRQLDTRNSIGRIVDVIYRGKRQAAEVRHVTDNENGFLVGLEWKNTFTG